MRVYAIGDLHLDSTKEKPMNIFGDNWTNHEQKIIGNWEKTVSDDDLVLIPGDISWAIKLNNAKKDLEVINNLPGKKVLIRGNHDYWWTTKNKLNNLKLESLEFLVNDFYVYNNIIICGVRGWDTYEIDSDIDSKKIYDRELIRFEMSLSKTINFNYYKMAMLHYPPFNIDKSPNDFVEIMKKYKIDTCIYGHLHGSEGHKLVREGRIEGINFVCVASDYLNFELREIDIA